MLKWIESTGRSEEAAIEAALVKLGMDRDEVSVELLERAKTGFLGIGSCPAKVKVSYEAPDEPVEKVLPVKDATPVHKEEPQKREEKQSASAPIRSEKVTSDQPVVAQTAVDLSSDPVAHRIEAFISGLLEHMGAQASPKVDMDEQGNYQVELVGSNLGSLIGRRGETLDAIQQLTVYAVNRDLTKRVRIHVDAEHYRAKREESLERLAHKVAGKVIKYRRNVTLEPMNAYERHVIHTALQDVSDITTYSVGTEPNRRTVVAYSRGERV